MNGKITMLFNKDGLSLKIKDAASGITFLRAALTSEQVMAAFSQQGLVDFEFEAMGLDKVGKQIQRDTLVFEMPEKYAWKDRDNIAEKLAVESCPEGWEPQLYFGSRNSFFQRDGREFGRIQIVKWVDAETSG